MQESGFPSLEEWNFTTIPPREVFAATVWELTRSSSTMSKAVRNYLSQPFSWTFDPMGDPQVIWGGGEAKASDTFMMLRKPALVVPEEVVEKLLSICPDLIYWYSVEGLISRAIDIDMPWVKVKPN